MLLRWCLVVALALTVGGVAMPYVRAQGVATPLAGTSVDHIGIVVRDIDKTSQAFREIFGAVVPPARELAPMVLRGRLAILLKLQVCVSPREVDRRREEGKERHRVVEIGERFAWPSQPEIRDRAVVVGPAHARLDLKAPIEHDQGGVDHAERSVRVAQAVVHAPPA